MRLFLKSLLDYKCIYVINLLIYNLQNPHLPQQNSFRSRAPASNKREVDVPWIVIYFEALSVRFIHAPRDSNKSQESAGIRLFLIFLLFLFFWSRKRKESNIPLLGFSPQNQVVLLDLKSGSATYWQNAYQHVSFVIAYFILNFTV